MSERARIIADRLRNTAKSNTVQSLTNIFSEEPVPLEVFVSDRKFLHNPPLSPPQYEFVRHFEQIYLPDLYPDMVVEFGAYWTPVRFVNFLAAEWGKGGGKDHTCRMGIARVGYLLLCLKSPQEYFSMPAQDEIQTLNVAASATQAHRAFFKPLRTVIAKSPWFADKFSGEIPGEQAGSIRFIKQIELVSGHSMAETLEGLNIIAAIADEISAFKLKDELEKYNRSAREPAKSAEAILRMLRTSARTRFPKNFKLAQISYPRFKGDAIEQAVLKSRQDNEAKGAASRMYVSGPLATWDVNPRVTGREDFEDDYEDDPITARAMYECLPELSPNRFYKNDTALYAAFGPKRDVPPITFEYYWGKDEGGGAAEESYSTLPTEMDTWQVRFHFAPDLVPLRGVSYAVHGDMAISGDRAGIAMTHVRNWERKDWMLPGGGYVLEQRPVVKVDFVTAFESDLTGLSPSGEPAPREVQIRWYRKLVWELVTRGFNIEMVSFDNFQSADTIQILLSRGIESQKVSTDRTKECWEALRDVMYDGRLEGYWNETLVNELMALTLLTNGKVDHPAGGSKDEADALAASVFCALELGGDEGAEPERADLPDDFVVLAKKQQSNMMSDYGVETVSLDAGGFGSTLW